MKIIKSLTYNVVDTEPFELKLPVEFELFCGNTLLASYKVYEGGQVDYQFNPKAKDKILTSTLRPLTLEDIYFLFTSRVFPNQTPFTQIELDRFGVEEYNPYEIVRRTHGIMPTDRYWVKFAGEDLNHKKALEWFNHYYKPAEEQTEHPVLPEAVINDTPDSDDCSVCTEKPPANDYKDIDSGAIRSLDSIFAQKSHEFSSIHDVGSILGNRQIDIKSLAAKIEDTSVTESAFAKGRPFKPKEKEAEQEISPSDAAVFTPTEFKAEEVTSPLDAAASTPTEPKNG
jgi:hypothetical protein